MNTDEQKAPIVWVDPWGKRGVEASASSMDDLPIVFEYIGGSSLSSSYATYWIEFSEKGQTWTLWQDLPGSHDWSDDGGDGEENDEEAEVTEVFASAGCSGAGLDEKSASILLLRELWREHQKTGYDHPNGLDTLAEGGILSLEEVAALIKEVFS